MSLIEQSVLRFFAFKCKGKYLCYYDSKPQVVCSNQPGQPPKGIICMDDITSLEDSPGGKKGHFIIHFGSMHMHLKSDIVALKTKWFDTITKLWNHYRALGESKSAGKSETKGQSLQSSPSHYKSQKINPKYLLEIAAAEPKPKADPKINELIRAKLKECMIQQSLDLLEPKVIQNHLFVWRMRIAKGKI